MQSHFWENLLRMGGGFTALPSVKVSEGQPASFFLLTAWPRKGKFLVINMRGE